MQPQLGTATQIPQGIWAIPQLFNQNSILIRGTQPDQPMFIQQQQPLQNNTSTHQHFTMRKCDIKISNQTLCIYRFLAISNFPSALNLFCLPKQFINRV